MLASASLPRALCPASWEVSDVEERGGRWRGKHTLSHWAGPVYFLQMRAGSSCLPRHPKDPAPGPPPSQHAPHPHPGDHKGPCWAHACPSSTPSVAWGLQTLLNKQQGVKPAIWNSILGSGRTTSRGSRGGAGGWPAHGRTVCAQEAAGEGEPTSAGHARQFPWGLGPWPPAAPQGPGPGHRSSRGTLGRQEGTCTWP